MPKPIEEQCKICQLYTEDRLKIEEKLKEGWSLNQVLKYVKNELGYTNISRSSIYRHKKHMNKVLPKYNPKPQKLSWKTTKPKGKPAWYDINRYTAY